MFELVFTLFLYSGLLKQLAGASGLEMPDVTVLFAAASLLLLFRSFTPNIFYRFKASWAPLLFFYFWILFSLIYSASESYSYFKAFAFLSCLLGFFLPIFYKKFDFDAFFKSFLIVGSIVGLYTVSILPTLLRAGADSEIYRSVYLSMGYLCALNALVSLYLATPGRYFYAVSAMVGFVVMAFLAGARGPLLFSCLLILAALFFSTEKRRNHYRLIGYLLPVVLGLVVFGGTLVATNDDFAFMVERSLDRLFMLAEEEGLDSRLVVFEFSINHIFSSLQVFFIGDGIGSFGLRHLNEDVRDYPHNLLLEVWFELGLVGLIAISLFLYKTGRNIFMSAGYLHVSIGIYVILNAFKSASLVDARVMYAFLALGLISCARRIQRRAD